MPEQKLQQAMEAFGRADFPTAIELLSEIVVDDSANAEAWLHLGVCYLETQRADLAVEALERAVGADPQHATAHYVLGNARGTLGQLEQAAACYRRALAIEPNHAKAEEFLIRAESLLESREHYRSGLQLLHSVKPSATDLNQAVRDLIQSVALFPNSPARDSIPDCARRLLTLKTEWLVHLQREFGSDLWARACERGYQCMRFENWVGGRAAYEEALGYRFEEAFVHVALGFCLAMLGEVDEAVRVWLRALELDPEYDLTRWGRVSGASAK